MIIIMEPQSDKPANRKCHSCAGRGFYYGANDKAVMCHCRR